MLAIQLRPGNAGSNNATDHITVIRATLAHLPDGKTRPGKGVLLRADSAGGTHDFLIDWLTERRLPYSVRFAFPHETPDLYRLIREDFWELALDADGEPQHGAASVDKFICVLSMESWLTDMRVIVRREPPSRARSSASASSTLPALCRRRLITDPMSTSQATRGFEGRQEVRIQPTLSLETGNTPGRGV